MSDFNVYLNIPFFTAREAEIAFQVIQVDDEPSRSDVKKHLTLKDNLLQVSFSGTEAHKIRTSVKAFFDNLILISETMEKFGPPESIYDHY